MRPNMFGKSENRKKSLQDMSRRVSDDGTLGLYCYSSCFVEVD